MWVDDARSVVAPELKRLVIIRRNLDTKSTHQRIMTSKLFEFVHLFAIGRHFGAERVVRSNESGRVSAFNKLIESHFTWRRRRLTDMSCVTMQLTAM